MARLIKDAELTEISWVDNPAQHNAKIKIVKSEDGKETEKMSKEKEQQVEVVVKANEDLTKKLEEITKAMEAKDEEITKLKEDLEKATSTEVEKEEKGEVVYTSKSGEKFYKGDDARLIQATKNADEAIAKVEDMELTKRANEISHTHADVEVRKAVIKALDSIEDEKVRKQAEETYLLAKEKENASKFEKRGTTSAPTGDVDPNEEIAKMVKDGVPERVAINKVFADYR